MRADPVEACTVSPGGELTPLKNAQQLLHRIAFVHRGGCPLLAKVRAAQAAGAFAVVVADVDGKCAGIFDQHCSPGADKARGEGLAATDSAAAWERIRIPVAMMHKEDSDKIEVGARAPSLQPCRLRRLRHLRRCRVSRDAHPSTPPLPLLRTTDPYRPRPGTPLCGEV